MAPVPPGMSEDSPSSPPERRSWLERLSLAFSGEPQTLDDLVEILREAQAKAMVDRGGLGLAQSIFQSLVRRDNPAT